MKVGGRDFEGDRETVEEAMRGVDPDNIQKYEVLVGGVAYPPKQVLEVVTGWSRTSFTTHEAQRVLARIGLPSREAFHGSVSVDAGDLEDRVAALEASLMTAQEAIAGMAARLRVIES